MAAVPPPQGMSEADYEAIEAAVTETVRGRWFLNEFSRRNRLAETRQLLEAMARLEAAVSGGQTALPSADPSIRLLIQRIKEIANQLGTIAYDMRDAGIDERYAKAVDSQARAVAGMMRSAAPGRLPLPNESKAHAQIKTDRTGSSEEPHSQRPALVASAETKRAAPPAEVGATSAATADIGLDDPRLAALSGLDSLTPSEKLSLFT